MVAPQSPRKTGHRPSQQELRKDCKEPGPKGYSGTRREEDVNQSTQNPVAQLFADTSLNGSWSAKSDVRRPVRRADRTQDKDTGMGGR